jgi:MFS family permease
MFGRKLMLLFAYAVFSIGCLLCGLARSMTELIVARGLAGIGGGGLTTVVAILLSDVATMRERGLGRDRSTSYSERGPWLALAWVETSWTALAGDGRQARRQPHTTHILR